MQLGFSGTQRAMTQKQAAKVAVLIAELGATDVHHGDCVGADAGFHEICIGLDLRVHIHPPVNDKKRAFCQAATSMAEPKEYIDRNRDIVDASQALIAAVASKREYRSGEWATIQYARRKGKPVCLIFPDGTVQNEPQSWSRDC